MTTLSPFAIELNAINVLQSQLTYTLYFLNRTSRRVDGSLKELESHIKQAQKYRLLGVQYNDLLSEQTQLKSQIEDQKRLTENFRNELSAIEQATNVKLSKIQVDRPKPEFDKQLANTITRRERKGYLIGSITAAGFGLLVFGTSDGAMGRFIGGGLFLGGGITTSVIYSKETDDSKEAACQRELKQQAESIETELNKQHRESKENLATLRRELQTSLQKEHQLGQRQMEVKDLIIDAKMMRQINLQMGDGILYGDSELLVSLERLVSKRSQEQDLSKGLASAAVIGLMVVGAFAGVNIN